MPLLLAPVLALGIEPALSGPKVDPNSMLVNGLRNPLHLIPGAPTFSWSFSGPGSQTNFWIQWDSQEDFQGHQGILSLNPWFWDSGFDDKGALNTATSIRWRDTQRSGTYSRPLDSRADLSYWRMRIQVSGDSNWTTDPNGWSPTAVMKMNQVPLPAINMTVSDDPSPGTRAGVTFPPLVQSPREFFVSTSGNDSNPGTSSQPFRTINKGVTVLDAGDTLTVRGGTYNENVQILRTRGVNDGTPGNPITIRNFPGETVVVRGGNAGPQPLSTISMIGSASQALQYWVIDGLVIGGSGVSRGIRAYLANRITIRGISFESTFNPGGHGIHLQNGRDSQILDSVFDNSMYEHIEVTGAKNVLIKGNRFSQGNGVFIVNFHSSGSFAGIIEENVFHDINVQQGVIELYLSPDGTIVRNNLVYNVAETSNGLAAAVEIIRCGKALIENNTFVNSVRGISYLEFSRYVEARNNIIANQRIAFDFVELQGSPPGSTALGAVISHNITFNNQKDFSFRFPGAGRPVGDSDPNVSTGDPALLIRSGNCFGCDPVFANPGAGNFHLTAGSVNAIDKGEIGTPVPLGGGTRVDIGAFEFGATMPYQFVPQATLGDTTPRITWSLQDPDNFLHAFDSSLFPTTDSQAAFELEIDTSNTFDSVNGRPIFSSGLVQSSTEGYTVPDADALPPGDYYVRVRQTDAHGSTGAWSRDNVRFRIQSEPQSPILNQQSPSPGEMGVDPNAPVVAHVVDFGSGVDSTTIQMSYAIDDPNMPVAVVPQIAQVTSTPQEYSLTFQPAPGIFPSGSTIFIRVQASDLFGSPPLDATYSFTIRDAAPPPTPSNLRLVP